MRSASATNLERREFTLPAKYLSPSSTRDVRLECGYRMDVVVEGELLIEIKTVERLLPIHEAQILTYLKLSGRKIGLLLNFNSVLLKDGLRRFVTS
jgi:GxxExxY protein